MWSQMLGEMDPLIAFSFKEQTVKWTWKFPSGYHGTEWSSMKPSASKLGIQEDRKTVLKYNISHNELHSDGIRRWPSVKNTQVFLKGKVWLEMRLSDSHTSYRANHIFLGK